MAKKPYQQVKRASRWVKHHQDVGYPKSGKEIRQRGPGWLDRATRAEDSASALHNALLHRRKGRSKQLFRRLKRGKKLGGF
jgi:hypothetical protein